MNPCKLNSVDAAVPCTDSRKVSVSSPSLEHYLLLCRLPRRLLLLVVGSNVA